MKYLKPIYLNFSELVAENIKSKMSNIISETIYDLNYSSGLGRRVSIRLGIASSGYNINI